MLMLGIFAFVMAYVFPLLFIWVTGALLAVLLLLFVELFELYRRVDGIDALRVVADKLSNGEENPVSLVVRNRYPVSTCLRVIDEIPVEFPKPECLVPAEGECRGAAGDSLHVTSYETRCL